MFVEDDRCYYSTTTAESRNEISYPIWVKFARLIGIPDQADLINSANFW